ncbi:MAG: hypothetical protein KDE31_29520 [Caldilineaceae bacterium]|nr:hypothetical protein [Caldilineaceae bacterium]
MRRTFREILVTIVGFVVASIIPAAVLSIRWPIDGMYKVESIVVSFAIAYPFSAAATVLLGLPAFFVLKPFRPGRWWAALAVGFVIGVVVAITVQLPSISDLKVLPIYGSLGAVSALVFWLIWKCGAEEG